jgi:hypothetical protein
VHVQLLHRQALQPRLKLQEGHQRHRPAASSSSASGSGGCQQADAASSIPAHAVQARVPTTITLGQNACDC